MPIGFEDPFCRACGAQGVSRGTVARCLAHVPVGWRPTQLVVRVRRLACTHCRRGWRQDTSGLAEPRARLTRSAVEWGLRALALECMSVSRVAAALGELLAHRQQRSPDPSRADHHRQPSPLRQRRGPRGRRFPRALRSRAGGTPYAWHHTKQGNRYVTVIIDLTPVRHRSGPARLLDVVPGRSKKVFKTWLAARGEVLA